MTLVIKTPWPPPLTAKPKNPQRKNRGGSEWVPGVLILPNPTISNLHLPSKPLDSPHGPHRTDFVLGVIIIPCAYPEVHESFSLLLFSDAGSFTRRHWLRHVSRGWLWYPHTCQAVPVPDILMALCMNHARTVSFHTQKQVKRYYYLPIPLTPQRVSALPITTLPITTHSFLYKPYPSAAVETHTHG